MRPGCAAAAKLFRSDDGADWRRALAAYDSCVAAAAKLRRTSGQLVQDDKWWREELPAQLLDAGQMEHSDLSRLMRWKLARGQFRPLQRLVDSNSQEAVAAATRDGVAKLRAADVDAGIAALCVLKGVGPATASAVAAAVCPAHAPFLSDEAMDAVPGFGARAYTASAYTRFRAAMVARAEELRQLPDMNDITAETLGRALWACARAARAAELPAAKKRRL
eukprot:TRINITY_DN21819_c0_g1_i1.p2 TRINITY_DN21819_c0_g1~~TRINITY_DN21819_c0_g1_i1.p2  ORF type:complete len:221 (+),score=68.61 TRINITY_DN21819_c0_g1_i1:61-723(+)